MINDRQARSAQLLRPLSAKEIHALIIARREALGGDVGDNHIKAVREIERTYLTRKI